MEGLDAIAATSLLDAAESFIRRLAARRSGVPTLRGRTVINLFYGPHAHLCVRGSQTKRLSADVINISASTSGAVKGRTLPRHH
jgi:aspartate carbamoyltransferase catalytic subunit